MPAMLAGLGHSAQDATALARCQLDSRCSGHPGECRLGPGGTLGHKALCSSPWNEPGVGVLSAAPTKEQNHFPSDLSAPCHP